MPPPRPYEPPAENQIIVLVEDEGNPFVLAIFDEIIAPSEYATGYLSRFRPAIRTTSR
jgi:hypothetical protein